MRGMNNDPRLGALDVWLSRGLDAQPSPRRTTPGLMFDVVLGGDFAAYEAERREAAEARHRVIVADLCDALGLSDEERASVTAYRGPGNPDALAFLVGDEVAAMVAGGPDETGNHPVTIAEGWRHRLRATGAQ